MLSIFKLKIKNLKKTLIKFNTYDAVYVKKLRTLTKYNGNGTHRIEPNKLDISNH